MSSATPFEGRPDRRREGGALPGLGLGGERGLPLGLELGGRPEVRSRLEVGVPHEGGPRARLDALHVAARPAGDEIARLLDDELGIEGLHLRPLGELRRLVDERGPALADRGSGLVGRRNGAVRKLRGLGLRPGEPLEGLRGADQDVGLAALREGTAQARHREELVRLLDALVEDDLELVDRRLEVGVALGPEELDERVGLLVGRDLLPLLLLGVRREELELGGLVPVLVALEAGAEEGKRRCQQNEGREAKSGGFHLER